MLSGFRLLSLGASTARRQGWAAVPLFVTKVIARLFGVVPSLFLMARFLHTGFHSGVQDPWLAYALGFLENIGNPAPWAVAAVGGLLAFSGGLLLFAVIDAGLLRLLAAQAGQTETASDEKFAEGVLHNPLSYLATAVCAEVLKFFAVGCGLGVLVSGMAFFVADPGPLAALLMTIATGIVLLLPFILASLDIGFARSVILDEPPWVAIAEGLALAWRRTSALLPAWYALVFVDLFLSVAIGMSSAAAGALPSDHQLWILKLGPMAFLWLAGIAGATIVELARLGVYAVLVAESAGTLPAPPPPPQILRAVPLGPEEPVFQAMAVPPEEPILRAVVAEPVLTAQAVEPPPQGPSEPEVAPQGSEPDGGQSQVSRGPEE